MERWCMERWSHGALIWGVHPPWSWDCIMYMSSPSYKLAQSLWHGFDFLDTKCNRFASCHFRSQQSFDFQGPPPSNGPWNEFARNKKIHRVPRHINNRYIKSYIIWLLPVKRTVESRSVIHEHTILFRFLGIILRVFRLEISVYNGPVSNHYYSRERGGGSVSRSDCEKQGGKLSKFGPNYVREFGLSSDLLELSVCTDRLYCTYLPLSSANFSSVFHSLWRYHKIYPSVPQLPPGRVMWVCVC